MATHSEGQMHAAAIKAAIRRAEEAGFKLDVEIGWRNEAPHEFDIDLRFSDDSTYVDTVAEVIWED